jgi:hypothetical protein
MATPIETYERHVHIVPFAYRSMHRRAAHCGIEAFIYADGCAVVIATELADNPGMSITNAAEYAATAVCRRLGIDPHHLVWIEHYPADPGPVCRGRTKKVRCRACAGRGVRRERDTYDRVRFAATNIQADLMFDDPTWSPITERDWHELGLEPRG